MRKAKFYLYPVLLAAALMGCGDKKLNAQDPANAPTAPVVKVERRDLTSTLEVASEFLPFQEIEVGRRVACIGAGNTAIDVVTAARRLGAEIVYLIYRRGEPQMPAFAYEYQLAKQDAVSFLWQTQPVRVCGRDGVVTGLECVRTELGAPDAKGRRNAVPVAGTEFEIEVDMIVRAVGQMPATDFLKAIIGVEINSDGTVKINGLHQTGQAKYFAGGDCTNGGKEVVDAVAEGMAAARGIDTWLGSPR